MPLTCRKYNRKSRFLRCRRSLYSSSRKARVKSRRQKTAKNGKKRQKTKRHLKGGNLTLNDNFIKLIYDNTQLKLQQNAYILGNGSYGRVINVISEIDHKYAIKESVNKVIFSSEKAKDNYETARTNEYHILRKNADKQNLIFTKYDEIKGQSIKDNSREAQYIITEPVCNSSLTVDSVKELTITQKINLIRQLYNAIITLHSYNVCHRDIKPDNILLKYDANSGDTSNINLYLTDFGLCTQLSENPPFNSNDFPNQIGTLKTKAPELFSKSKNYGLDSDWWGFGMIIHFILFKTLPLLIEEKSGFDLRGLLENMADDDTNLGDFTCKLHNEIDSRKSKNTNCVALIKKCLGNRDSRRSITMVDIENLSNDIQFVHVRDIPPTHHIVCDNKTHTLYRNNAYHYIKNIDAKSDLLSTRRVKLNSISDTIVSEILHEKSEINPLNPQFKELFLSKLSEKIKNGLLQI